MLRLSDNELYALAGTTVKCVAGRLFAGFFSTDALEQLTVDVAAKAWQNRDRYDENLGTPATWVGRIARNEVLDAYGAERRYRSLFSPVALQERVDEDGDAAGFTPIAPDETDAFLIADDTKRHLRRCVTDGRGRRLFDGLAAGLGSAELAKCEGVPAARIYTPVSLLRTRLRRRLDSAS